MSTPATDGGGSVAVRLSFLDRYPAAWILAAMAVGLGLGRAVPGLGDAPAGDWELADPAGQGVAAVRPIRDEIERRIRGLLGELGLPAGPVQGGTDPA